MWRARMKPLGSMHCFSPAGFASSGCAPFPPRPRPYQTGPVTRAPNTTSPATILPASNMGGLHLRGRRPHRLLAEVELALVLALHHERVRDELGDPDRLHVRGPELADGG